MWPSPQINCVCIRIQGISIESQANRCKKSLNHAKRLVREWNFDCGHIIQGSIKTILKRRHNHWFVEWFRLTLICYSDKSAHRTVLIFVTATDLKEWIIVHVMEFSVACRFKYYVVCDCFAPCFLHFGFVCHFGEKERTCTRKKIAT